MAVYLILTLSLEFHVYYVVYILECNNFQNSTSLDSINV